MFAEDVGIPYGTLRVYRFTAGHWPAEHRAEGVPFEIHRILEQLPDRFQRITDPPVHPRTGKRCWTQDAAKRQVGWRVGAPQSVQEKVQAIHDLAADEQVAARVAADLLRRPAVAERAAADKTARHLFNRAQNDRWHQPERPAAPAPGLVEPSPVAPVVRGLDDFVRKRRVVGMMAILKVEPAGLGDLRIQVTTIAADLQEATVAEGIRRGPFTRRPDMGVFSGRKASEQDTLPIVQGRPPMHTDQLTPRPRPLQEPKE
ncbi:DUF6192 family protein [Streptomyces sp. NPDC001889]